MYQFQPFQTYQPFPQFQPQVQVQTQPVIQQQILQASGKASIDALRMAPGSSAYIEDTTGNNLVWKCTADSLGKVTAQPFDLSPHEQAPIIDNTGLLAIVGTMNDRLTKLEGIANEWQSANTATTTSDSSTSTKTVGSAKSATSRNTVANGG